MRIYGLGLDHRSCPLEPRERLSVTADTGRDDGPRRAVDANLEPRVAVLSTCHRLEVYGHFDAPSERFSCARAYVWLAKFLATRSGCP